MGFPTVIKTRVSNFALEFPLVKLEIFMRGERLFCAG